MKRALATAALLAAAAVARIAHHAEEARAVIRAERAAPVEETFGMARSAALAEVSNTH